VLVQALYGSEHSLSIASRLLVLDISVPNAVTDSVVRSSDDDTAGAFKPVQSPDKHRQRRIERRGSA
jgi:hypothetical protein